MAAFKPVKLLDQCEVAPPPGSVSPTSTAFALTFFDVMWLPLPPVETLYFYDFPYPESEFTHSLLPRLKRSLSSTLIHFYPLSGKLSWPLETNQPMISYTEGDSVSFTVAESDADFSHLSSSHLKYAIESHPLVPKLTTSGPVLPILAIQITVFPNAGICIGFTRSHSCCDGRGFKHFIKTWASMSKLEAPAPSPSLELLPLLDRTLMEKHDDGMSKLFLSKLEGFMGSESVSGNRILRVMDVELQPNMVRATFELNEAKSRRLKEWVFAQYKNDEKTKTKSIPPSRLVAICAYSWMCMLKAEAIAGEFNNTSNSTTFGLNVDCRARMDPPIPETYLGNCVRPYMAIADKTHLMRGGVAVAAQLLGDAIQEMEKGVLTGMGRAISGMFDIYFFDNTADMPAGRQLAVAGSPQFAYYETDFGFGRPQKVEMTSTDKTGAMFFKDNRMGDGGFEFDLVLSKPEMDVYVSEFVDGLSALDSTC